MGDFLAALGLMLVFEGLLYGGFPKAARRLALDMQAVPESVMRLLGVAAIAAGVGLVWLVRGG